MGDLQDLDLREAAREQGRVDLLLDVAGEEEAMAADRTQEDDRDVVDPRPTVGRALRDTTGVGPQHLELDVVDAETISSHEDSPADPAGRERGVEGRVPGSRPDHPGLEHLPDAVSIEDADESGGVVLVGMAEDDDIDPPIPRREMLIEGHEDAAGIRPTVDQEPAAAAALEEDRVALSDVEDRQPGNAVRAMDDRDHERDHRDREPADERALGTRPEAWEPRRSGPRRGRLPGRHLPGRRRRSGRHLRPGRWPAGVRVPPRRPAGVGIRGAAEPLVREEHQGGGHGRDDGIPRRNELDAGERHGGARANEPDDGPEEGPRGQAPDGRNERRGAERGEAAGEECDGTGGHRRGHEGHDAEVDDRCHDRQPPELEGHDREGRQLGRERHPERLGKPGPKPTGRRAGQPLRQG
jgi:hypothetical protein